MKHVDLLISPSSVARLSDRRERLYDLARRAEVERLASSREGAEHSKVAREVERG
jgi:hypothetical protein